MNLLDIIMASAALVAAVAVGGVCLVGFIVWLAGTNRSSEPRRN